MTNASLFLRIDDLDKSRAKPAYVHDIFDTLEFLGLDWQEGPGETIDLVRMYSQAYRMPLYEAAMEQLGLSGDVFACTCSRSGLENVEGYPGTCREKNLPLDTAGACWRLKTDPDEVIVIKNFTGGVFSTNLPVSMTDFIVRKKDGFPSYQLTSVVDDVFFHIDLIVRGEDLLPSSLAQIVLARKLGYEDFAEAVFFFHELLKDTTGRKLSKTDGDLSIASMIKSGLRTEDIFRKMGRAIGMDPGPESMEPLAGFILDRYL